MVNEVGHGLVDLRSVDGLVVLEHGALRQRVQLVDQDRQHLVNDVHTGVRRIDADRSPTESATV